MRLAAATGALLTGALLAVGTLLPLAPRAEQTVGRGDAAPAASGSPPSAGEPAERAGEPARAVVAPARTAKGLARHARLLPLVEPLWNDLSESRRQVLEPFASQWNGWSAAEKRKWLALADRVPKMKPENRARAQQRIEQWASLTPEQRRIARQNWRIARKLPPDERLERWERYQQLPPEEQKALRERAPAGNTAARYAGPASGLAREAAQPLAPWPPSGEQ